jgi:hypothetical protein
MESMDIAQNILLLERGPKLGARIPKGGSGQAQFTEQ